MVSHSTSNSIYPRLNSRFFPQHLLLFLCYLVQQTTHPFQGPQLEHHSMSFDSPSTSQPTSSSSFNRTYLWISFQFTSLFPTATATVWALLAHTPCQPPLPLPAPWSNSKLWLNEVTTQALPTHFWAVGLDGASSQDSPAHYAYSFIWPIPISALQVISYWKPLPNTTEPVQVILLINPTVA